MRRSLKFWVFFADLFNMRMDSWRARLIQALVATGMCGGVVGCAVPGGGAADATSTRTEATPTPTGPTAASQNGFGGSGVAITSGVTSSFVLYQNDFVSKLLNRDGGSVKIDGIGFPFGSGAYVDPNHQDRLKFFTADSGNNRILIYNSIPTSAAALPDVVVGQPNFTTNTAASGGGVNAAGLYTPSHVSVCTNGKMFITDTPNHRVLGFNTVPQSNGAAANFVIGQTTMSGNTSGTTAIKLKTPRATWCIDNRLFIADAGNNRVLIYNTIPSTTNPSADLVIGQPDLISTAAACTDTGLGNPQEILYVGGKLHIADQNNNRIMIYNSLPTTSGVAADSVIGQPDMTSCLARQGGSVAANNLYSPTSLATNGTKLAIADSFNNRITFYTLPVATNQAASHVLGQATLIASVAANPPTASSVRVGRGLIFDTSGFLWNTDYTDSRMILLPLPF